MGRFALTKSIGMIVLAVWLILTGLLALFGINFGNRELVMGILAIVAGVLILLDG